jgi:hypothetical protein
MGRRPWGHIHHSPSLTLRAIVGCRRAPALEAGLGAEVRRGLAVGGREGERVRETDSGKQKSLVLPGQDGPRPSDR